MKYRRKVLEVEAVQLLWENWIEICDFAGVGFLSEGKPEGFNPDGKTDVIGLLIPTPEGLVRAIGGDYICKDVEGNLYPCKQSVFEKIYEPITEGEK